ncbi:MAG: phosphoribosylformylglycinamidine synthase [Hyphomicrobiales bacterium]|nr:MAG: phosphoribosylformylglycinamidine synthase [Hyphomicrobiales bacterium]
MMKARITITLKAGVLDPQGKAIEGALDALDFSGINKVRQGKIIDIDIDAASETEATSALTEMCEKLLANTVIENYAIDIRD